MKRSSDDQHYPAAGIYEHYKSTPQAKRYYQVIGLARHTETEETLVVYVPLYVSPGETTGFRLQARPLDMFMETVEYGGKVVPRFQYIGREL